MDPGKLGLESVFGFLKRNNSFGFLKFPLNDSVDVKSSVVFFDIDIESILIVVK
jgi:hypothetical protein